MYGEPPVWGAPVGESRQQNEPPPLRLSDFPTFSRLSREVPRCSLPCLVVPLDFLMVLVRLKKYGNTLILAIPRKDEFSTKSRTAIDNMHMEE